MSIGKPVFIQLSLGTMKVKPMSKQEFDRKASTKIVGQLYPVLLSKDGLIIDGHHRLEDDPEWRSTTLEHIDTEEKIVLARCASNWHRRSIGVAEKREWVNALARIYESQGLKVHGPIGDHGGTGRNQIVNKIIENTGVGKQTIMKHLHDKYKQNQRPGPGAYGPRVPASQAIKKLAKGKGSYSGSLVERHEKEVRDKLLNDESFHNEILEKIGKKTGNPKLANNSISDDNELLNCLCSECTDRKKCQEMSESA